MTPLAWITAFAAFAKVVPDVLEAFKAQHPELREPPPVAADERIDADIDDAIDAKFSRPAEVVEVKRELVVPPIPGWSDDDDKFGDSGVA